MKITPKYERSLKQRDKKARIAIRYLERKLRSLSRRPEPKFFDDVEAAYDELLYVYRPHLDPANQQP